MMHPSNEVTTENVATVFQYHPPSEAQKERYVELRRSAEFFASRVLELCPRSADRSAAIRKIREALMVANASIALEDEEPV